MNQPVNSNTDATDHLNRTGNMRDHSKINTGAAVLYRTRRVRKLGELHRSECGQGSARRRGPK